MVVLRSHTCTGRVTVIIAIRMTGVSVHVLLQVHFHAVVVTLFLLGQSVVLNVRVAVPVAAVHVLAAQLFLKRIARLEAHELVQIEENVEQHA